MNKKSAMIRARVTPELKERAEAVMTQLGIRPSDAISLFYAQVVLQQAIPFPIKLPQGTNQNEPVPPPPAWHLPDVWQRLKELDEWRTFSGQLHAMTLDD